MDRRAVQNNWHDTQSAILCRGITGLDSVFTGQSVLYVQVHIENVMTFTLFDDRCQFPALFTNLLDVLGVDALFSEVH